MQQVKIFKSVETEIWTLENEINQWIQESGVRVLQITGNIAPQTAGADPTFPASDVLVIVLYESRPNRSEPGAAHVSGG